MGTIAPQGLHHVTAIASAPQRNVDFYSTVLGLRLIKRTVNFDAPDSWHLYYGDERGTPSSILTFFPWPDVPRGRYGAGMTSATAFSLPGTSLSWWHDRLKAARVDVDAPITRGAEEVVTLRDPDGMVLDLVATDGDHRSGWDGVASIPAQHGIRGLHSVTMNERLLDPTASMLTDLLGMGAAGDSAGRSRFQMAAGNAGAVVDVTGGANERGYQAGGTVHHVAFRAPDLPTMTAWQQQLVEAGVGVTEILDRQYFKSIYFREPGGVLFEIATDTPGFDIDEPLLELGRSLKLPPWLEPSREQIARSLPPITLPDLGDQQA